MGLPGSHFYTTVSEAPSRAFFQKAPANGLISPGPLSLHYPEYLKKKLLLDKFSRVSDSYFAFFSFSLTPDVFTSVSNDQDLIRSAYAFFNDCVLIVNNENNSRSGPKCFLSATLYEPTSRLVYAVRQLSEFVCLAKIAFHPDDRRVFVLSLEFPEENHFWYEYFTKTFNVDF